MSDKAGGTPQVVFRARSGKRYAVPVDELAKHLVPQDAILLRWGPRRHILMREAELERFLLTEEESLIFTAYKGGSRRRIRRPGA